MVLVPSGWFPYQDTSDPDQWVYVEAFMIDKYEVTKEWYCEFLNATDPNGEHWHSLQGILRHGDQGSYWYTVSEGLENYPVQKVNYFDAEAFAAWKSSLYGDTYRLPTHHEWEKAAAWDPVEQHYYTYAFHEDSIDCPWCSYNFCTNWMTPVGSYNGTEGTEDAHSYYGCYDMSGNVWEWTAEASDGNRIIRGGTYGHPENYVRCVHRCQFAPAVRDGAVGFRLVLEQYCLGDLYPDGEIDLVDLAIVLSNYGETGMTYLDGDLDEDGDVDLSDLSALLAVYGTTCE